MNFFLRISYRLKIEKWPVRGQDKTKFENKKNHIQRQFREKVGLIVNKTRPGVSGTSNDGNISRDFF